MLAPSHPTSILSLSIEDTFRNIFLAAIRYDGEDDCGRSGDYSVAVRASPGNRNASPARTSVTRRTTSFAFSASTPASVDRYVNCVGPANRVPDASTISA